MFSSRKRLKAVLVAVLAVVLLTNAILPVTVMGSDRDTNTDYQYYVIKSGDTLTRIAKNYGVTVSDIMTVNNLSNADRIVTGNVIKVPLSSSGSGSSSALVSTRLSLNLVDANIRDVISAIARNAGYTVIFVGDSNEKLTVNLEQMSALKAVDYVTRLVDLTYLKDGNTLMVGEASDLNNKFVDKVVMSKFTLKYITVPTLQAQASALGLSDVQYVSTDRDDSTVYISAYPKELAKIQELVNLLDVSSNISSGAALITSNFTYIDLQYIDAAEFSSLLANLGLDPGIVLSSRPYTLYTFVTGAALADIKTIKSIVDRPLTGNNLTASGTASDDVITTQPSGGTSQTEPTTNPSTPTNPDTTTPPATQQNTILREIALNYINREAAVEIINSFPYSVTVYGPEKMTKKIWLMGTEDEVNKAENKIKEFDTEDYADSLKLENGFFVYDLTACTAQEMLDRLASFNLEGVTFKTNAYPTVSKALIVTCEPSKQEQIKNLLAALDTATTSETEYRVVESTGTAGAGKQRIDTLRMLHPEIPAAADFQYVAVTDKTGSSTNYVTYVKATPEMVDYIKALLQEMDAG